MILRFPAFKNLAYVKKQIGFLFENITIITQLEFLWWL